jgi:hypothetical protein
VEAAIFALPGVVESATDLDGELCGDVAACLLRLEESFAISNFDQRRHVSAWSINESNINPNHDS